MTNKRILNITSEKKRDTMISVYKAGSAATAAVGPATMNGGNPTQLIWCATARDNTVSNGGAGAGKFQQATRSATTCYMRGLKEVISVQTTSGIPWEWRRICFCFRNTALLLPSVIPYIENSNGFGRLMYNLSSGSSTDNAATAALNGFLFKGVVNVDWNSYLTAPIDTTRVDLKFDRTYTLQSGNANGMYRRFSFWHAMNKNLTYDDDEQAGGMNTSYYSVTDKRGMGDYYVADFFFPLAQATSTDSLIFYPQASLYWHEK